jgi:cytochrome c biogenesis protein ResB
MIFWGLQTTIRPIYNKLTRHHPCMNNNKKQQELSKKNVDDCWYRETDAESGKVRRGGRLVWHFVVVVVLVSCLLNTCTK